MYRQDFADYCMVFPDGEDRVVIHAPCKDISFTFTREEFYDLREAIDEALLLQQVYDLIR